MKALPKGIEYVERTDGHQHGESKYSHLADQALALLNATGRPYIRIYVADRVLHAHQAHGHGCFIVSDTNGHSTCTAKRKGASLLRMLKAVNTDMKAHPRRISMRDVLAAVREHALTVDIHAFLGGSNLCSRDTVWRMLGRADRLGWIEKQSGCGLVFWELTELGKEQLR